MMMTLSVALRWHLPVGHQLYVQVMKKVFKRRHEDISRSETSQTTSSIKFRWSATRGGRFLLSVS